MEQSGSAGESPAEQSQDSTYLSNKQPEGHGRSSGARVLIVDDEHAIRRFLHVHLSSHGYDIFEADTGRQALDAVRSTRPDVILLDLGLPDLDGVQVTRTLREWNQTPIIVLSVRHQEEDKIAALDSGADDYLTKPFGPGELLARIRAVLRRVHLPETAPIFVVGELSVDLNRHSVTLRGQRLQLTPTEFLLLATLIRHTGKLMTHRQVVREVWGGAGVEDELHLLRVTISNLRRKLEQNPSRPQYIITEPGIGYRLRTDEW